MTENEHLVGNSAGFDRLDAEAVMGARASLETLYLNHYRDIYRYVLCLTRSHEEAEDITEETFERALRGSLDAGVFTRPFPWLLLVARRIATDRWRRARHLVGTLTGAAATHEEGSQQASEFWLWFDALSKALTQRQREALLLRYQRDLSDEEIGLILGLTPSGVRSLVARALAVLRTHPELLA